MYLLAETLQGKQAQLVSLVLRQTVPHVGAQDCLLCLMFKEKNPCLQDLIGKLSGTIKAQTIMLKFHFSSKYHHQHGKGLAKCFTAVCFCHRGLMGSVSHSNITCDRLLQQDSEPVTSGNRQQETKLDG